MTLEGYFKRRWSVDGDIQLGPKDSNDGGSVECICPPGIMPAAGGRAPLFGPVTMSFMGGSYGPTNPPHALANMPACGAEAE